MHVQSRGSVPINSGKTSADYRKKEENSHDLLISENHLVRSDMFRIAIPSGPVMPVQDSCAYTYNKRLGPQPVGPSCLHIGNCTVCTAESSISVVGRHEERGGGTLDVGKTGPPISEN